MKNILLYTLILAISTGSLIAKAANIKSVLAVNEVSDSIELAALKQLYIDTDGDNWQDKTNWPDLANWPITATSVDFATWFGITVINGDVKKIELDHNNLSGIIPSSLSDLSKLEYLDLYNNLLTGAIPFQLGGLIKLKALELQYNQLTGEIPSELGSLGNLINLKLYRNQLSGEISGSLGGLVKLKNLQLNNNSLTGDIPAEFGNLLLLKKLHLHNNQLTGEIPGSLGGLTNIKYLQLNNNSLTGNIPAELGNLLLLKTLYLHNNQMTGGIPTQLGQLANLSKLNFYNNSFTGNIPVEFGNLTLMTNLYLDDNLLSGNLPSELGNLLALKNFQAHGNDLTGSIPPTLGNLTNLTYLSLHQNKLTGSIPAELGNLILLENLQLHDNLLTGSIPTSLGNLTQLTTLNLRENQLSGNIPASIGNLLKLKNLYLEDNQLTGEIPAAIISITTLKKAYFNINRLTACPDFTTNTNASGLRLSIKRNYITFADIETNLTGVNAHNFSFFSYKPQYIEFSADTISITVTEGETLTISQEDNGAQNNYKWQKLNGNNWQDISAQNEDASGKSFVKSSMEQADAGTYRFKITNNWITNTTITSIPFEVKVLELETAIIDGLSFQYKYDSEQRMIEKKVPGAGWVYMVYDDRDRLVLTQDANQRSTKAGATGDLWTFIKYDYLNRPILTGITSITGDVTAIRTQVDNVTVFFESQNTPVTHGYTNNAYPQVYDESQYLTVTYYDDYNFPHATTYAYTDELSNGAYHTEVIGQVTGGKVKNLKDNSWLKSVAYYDDRYRVIQAQGDNNLGGIDMVSNKYDFVSKVLETLSTHDDGTASTTIHRTFDYDHADRLLSVKHSINGATDITIMQNEYNAIGELVDKKLHSTDGTSFMQSVDYRYNIRGWLTSMNNATIDDSNTAINDDQDDYFGFELAYNNTVTGLNNTTTWNGNISAMNWSDFQSAAGVKERAFSYGYDAMNRLTSAQHHTKTAGAYGNVSAYSVSGLGYDLNGNINSLIRNNENSVVMDSLTYDYGSTKSNQLLNVSDGGHLTDGFKDGDTGTDQEYFYDDNGNMTQDDNKGIVSIEYNHLNLPEKVDMGSGNYIAYAYDAAGIKLQQKVYEVSVLTKTTDYAGEYIYETDASGIRKLQFIQHEEGRIVPEPSGDMTYQYHLKDHLGNTRVTFTSGKYISPYLATMEDAVNATEALDFNNLDNRVTYPVGGKAVMLNRNNPFGPSIGLNVSRGDTIAMSVKAYYEDASGFGNVSLSLTEMAALVSGAFGAGGIGSESQTVYDLFSAGSAGPALLGGGNGNDAIPSAYLNYLLFDPKDSLIDNGFFNVESGVNLVQTIDISNLIINQAGYIYIYLTNESDSDNPVYFDDFSITVSESPVLENTDYYPFGLTFNSYDKKGMIGQNFKFQGQEHISDLGLNWDSFKWRNSQPDLGRFFNVDPLAAKYVHNSPYAFSENRVTSSIELEGLEAVDLNSRDPNLKGATKEELKAFHQGEVRGLELFGAVASIFTPGPEDLIIAGALATKVGGAIAKYGDDIVGVVTKYGDDAVGWAKSFFSKTDEAVDATKNRVKLRKNTKGQILDDAPRNADGDFIDPNTGQIVPKDGPFDIGHKPGQEWKRRKKMHQNKNSTRKEVIEAENDSKLYQVEDPSSNRSHKFEKKD